MFDVQYKEKRQQFSPDAITEMIYRKMLGRFCSGDQALLDPILLKGWQSDNQPQQNAIEKLSLAWHIKEPLAVKDLQENVICVFGKLQTNSTSISQLAGLFSVLGTRWLLAKTK